MMTISVVIPTYNRLARLQRVLEALEEQAFPCKQFEVIVVSDGSRDGTEDYLQSFRSQLNLKAIFQENAGVAVARNRGIEAAHGEYVLFLDDDVVPAPRLIAEHVNSHVTAGANAVVLGPMLSPDGFRMTPWVAWEQAMLVKHYEAMEQGLWEPTARQFHTGNASLARFHLLAEGGFDPAFRRAEDVELAYRLDRRGLRFLFNPQAVGYHFAERNYESWINIAYAYGRNDVIFTRDKGVEWLLPTIWREYHGRSKLIRWVTRAFLDRPLLSQITSAGLRQIAIAADRSGQERISNVACSSMYNLRIYQGIADGLGGREAFFAGVAQNAPVESDAERSASMAHSIQSESVVE